MEIADWERRVPRVGNELDQVFTTTSLEEVRGTAEGERGEEYRISNKEFRMSKGRALPNGDCRLGEKSSEGWIIEDFS